MRLSDASVAIRPRTAWEAMDLGVLMAREHRWLLMSSWALVSLPVFALLTVLLWESPLAAVLLFWWLKPVFDRLPLYILSKALFGNTQRQTSRAPLAATVKKPVAGQPDLAASQPEPQFRAASEPTRRPGWPGAPTPPRRAVTTQRRGRALADNHWHAPGNRPVAWLHGAVLSLHSRAG